MKMLPETLSQTGGASYHHPSPPQIGLSDLKRDNAKTLTTKLANFLSEAHAAPSQLEIHCRWGQCFHATRCDSDWDRRMRGSGRNVLI